MLVLLIPVAWLVIVLIGLAMCRLGALSDRSDDAAVADWLAMSCFDEQEADIADGPPKQLPFGPSEQLFGPYRATG